ncbi:MAG TPA: chemotaxis protein [Bacillaceae bacterium]
MTEDRMTDDVSAEIEIIEFVLKSIPFGVNVLKVKEIIMPVPVAPVPHAHPFIQGMIQLRGELLPLISLEKALCMEPDPARDTRGDKFLIMEYNLQKVAFHVHQVPRIYRLGWKDVQKPTEDDTEYHDHLIGIAEQNGKQTLLLDFEKLIVEIHPESGIHPERIPELGKRERSMKKIVAAEDSPLLRKLIHETLYHAGYEDVEYFENGKDALDYLMHLADGDIDITESVQLVLTDIEMPQMGGHQLASSLRTHPELSKLPVIIFSSIITDEFLRKGEEAGVAAQVSKPEIGKLVLKIDEVIL